MSYANFDDVIKRFPPLSTLVGSNAGTQINTADVSSIYINDAESYVNAFLRSKYIIPITSEPIITEIVSDIAIYRMCEDRQPRIPDFCEKRFISANSMLCMLRDGVMTLASSTLTSGGDQDVFSTVGSYHPVFSPVLRDVDQKADSDYVRSEKDERISDWDSRG